MESPAAIVVEKLSQGEGAPTAQQPVRLSPVKLAAPAPAAVRSPPTSAAVAAKPASHSAGLPPRGGASSATSAGKSPVASSSPDTASSRPPLDARLGAKSAAAEERASAAGQQQAMYSSWAASLNAGLARGSWRGGLRLSGQDSKDEAVKLSW